jgi:hypothetical protein
MTLNATTTRNKIVIERHPLSLLLRNHTPQTMKATLDAREEFFMSFSCSQDPAAEPFIEACPLIVPTNSSALGAAFTIYE